MSLCDALAVSGMHLAYRDEIRPKDVKRLIGAADTMPAPFWRQASDLLAARAALAFLTGTDTI